MSQQRLELLAPAGDADCLAAAVGAGADAVYFGLSVGFNARIKAPGFGPEELPRVFDHLHERGVKGYVTFNTVVFDAELDVAQELLIDLSEAGADAVIVQDLGVARMCQALVPDLPLHASTQMTVSSPEAAAIAEELGAKRIILPRELSIEEIQCYRRGTRLELECFVHGALCVSYSGQCLTSEAWGERSANRGQCAQSCRLPYDLVVDGRRYDKGVERYLLSPKDLAAYNLLGQLADAGVTSFKIEGRYKGPDYVAAAVEKYRRALDAVQEGRAIELTTTDVEDLSFTFTRGFSPGWLLGDDHRALNHGLYPGHRGIFVGHVVEVRGYRVYVRLVPDASTLKPGDWMVFGQGAPEDDEPKGGIFSLGERVGDVLELRFGEPGPDLTRVRPGDELWKSHDSAVKRRLRRYLEADRKLALDLVVKGAPGEPLVVEAEDALGRKARVTSAEPLEAARTRPLDEAIVRDKLAAFGDTRWRLRRLELHLEGAVATSPASLKRLRRELTAALTSQGVPKPSRRRFAVERTALAFAGSPPVDAPFVPASEPRLIPLCRTLEQVDAALRFGVRELYIDRMELVGLSQAVEKCRAAGVRVVIATMRIQKPGEEPIDRRFERLAPDGILARHLGAIEHYRHRVSHAFALHGDFSLNCTNAVTGHYLLSLGVSTLTPSYDLNLSQLQELATGLPAERLEVTVHQHLPLYHTEYCVYAHNLSNGRNYEDCGRPCETHRVHLRDAKGLEHPVLVDVHCRNTVFNAQAQTAASHFGRLLALGIRRLRVELVWESAAETTRVLASYARLLAGEGSAAHVLAEIGAVERYGVTAGTLQVQRSRLPVVA